MTSYRTGAMDVCKSKQLAISRALTKKKEAESGFSPQSLPDGGTRPVPPAGDLRRRQREPNGAGGES